MNSTISKWFFYFVIPIGIIVLALFLPLIAYQFDASTILGAISLLFAILVGFFIATATTNYLQLQSLVAAENSGWSTIFNLGVLLDPRARKRLADAIDLYVIATLNFELIDYVEKTVPAFARVISVLDSVRPKQKDFSALIQNFHDEKAQMVEARQEIPLAARRIVTLKHWIVIGSLAALVVILLFLLRDGRYLSSIVIGTLSAACYLILVLLYEIDGNFFAEEKLAFDNVQMVFQAIGKLDYYPSYALRQNRIHDLKKPYRTGTFKDIANPQAREIKTIK